MRGGVIPLREKKQGNEKEEDILSIKNPEIMVQLLSTTQKLSSYMCCCSCSVNPNLTNNPVTLRMVKCLQIFQPNRQCKRWQGTFLQTTGRMTLVYTLCFFNNHKTRQDEADHMRIKDTNTETVETINCHQLLKNICLFHADK